MFPVINIGPLALQAPGLLLLIGIWLGLGQAERSAARHQVDANQLYNLAFVTFLGAVSGARLAFIAQYPGAFRDLGSFFSLSPQLLDIWGGAAGGLLAAVIYANKKRLPLWPTLDALTPALAIAFIFGHIANLASGAAFGSSSTLPWSIELWGEQRHPSQVYEAMAAFAIWVGLQLKTRLPSLPAGAAFLSFAAWSAGARLFLEAFRGDSFLLPGGIRLAQVAAWLLLAGCLWLYHLRTQQQ